MRYLILICVYILKKFFVQLAATQLLYVGALKDLVVLIYYLSLLNTIAIINYYIMDCS